MAEETGDLIKAMKKEIFGEELAAKIAEVRKDQGWDEFWLVFQQKPDMFIPNLIRNGWVATNQKPNPISNTIHFYVNWKSGRTSHKIFPPDKEGSDLYNYPIIKGEHELDMRRKLGLPTEGIFVPNEGVIY